MKLNILLDESDNETLARRSRRQDAIRIDTEIKLALDDLGGCEERRAAFLRLLTHVRSCSTLLRPTPSRGTPRWRASVFLINRLKNLATRQRHWLRPCETWRWDGANLRPAFRSLAHHLVACHPVPGFMDRAWDLPGGAEGFRQQSWYIRLGRGARFRALNLPLLLTRAMEHHVRQAPDHYTVYQALRYGETRGLGGSRELAREVAMGLLGRRIEHPAFWRTLLSFLVVQPQLKLEHVNPIIDFVQANKFGEVLTEDGGAIGLPQRPEFSMHGRTLKSLLRLVGAWHAELAGCDAGRGFGWRASGIQGYRFLEKLREDETHERDWTVQELLDSRALHEEGRAMRHCVYSYANRCRCGGTTIWSLRLRVDGRQRRMATIEVDPRRRAIVQARAKCNRFPGVQSLEIIRRWAASSGLQLDLRL